MDRIELECKMLFLHTSSALPRTLLMPAKLLPCDCVDDGAACDWVLPNEAACVRLQEMRSKSIEIE